MQSWRQLTEDDAGLNQAERAAYRSSLLGQGESDRLPTILTSVAMEIRGAVRSCRSNMLSTDPLLVPESAIHHAGALIRYRLMSHFPGGASETRRKEYEDARQWLRDVAACRYLIEPPGDADESPAPPKAGPKFSRPTLTQSRRDADGA
jgi:hypothetical protein